MKNVLIVEKDHLTASAIASPDSIFSCTEVSDAAQAGHMLETGGYDVVVMDCSVSGLSCLSLVKALRKDESPGCPYIIILECPDDDVAREAFIRAGADDVISGPTRFDEVKRSLKTAHRILTLTDRLDAMSARIMAVDKAAAIGRLVPGIAHEINNPLGFVSSNLSVLDDYCRTLCDAVSRCRDQAGSGGQSTLPPDIEPGKIDDVLSDVFPLLDECRQGLERIKKLVSDIQQVSHDDGQPVDLNVNDCLDVAVRVLWNELKYKTVINKSYGQLPLVFCHPGRLYHVLLHLLQEAVGAIAEKGDIHITTTNGDGYVSVTIAGSGSIGKAASFLENEPENDPGHGHGLHVARRIVREHDGFLEIEASADAGTVFRLRLPVKKNMMPII